MLLQSWVYMIFITIYKHEWSVGDTPEKGITDTAFPTLEYTESECFCVFWYISHNCVCIHTYSLHVKMHLVILNPFTAAAVKFLG